MFLFFGASVRFSLQFPAKGAVLEGGEEGVQFGEVGALRGLLALDGFDDGGEFLLEGKRGAHHFDLLKLGFCDRLSRRSGSANPQKFVFDLRSEE